MLVLAIVQFRFLATAGHRAPNRVHVLGTVTLAGPFHRAEFVGESVRVLNHDVGAELIFAPFLPAHLLPLLVGPREGQ